MTNSKSSSYFTLIAVILLGGLLRFWHLDLKPIWLDEIITALFSLGRNYTDVPLDVVFPVERLSQIFSFKAALSCPQIAANLATYSVHPPLFFCLNHRWVQAPFVGLMHQSWVWSLRSLPAVFGVAAIAAIYWLNAIAFSRTAGIFAAALMAVSPYAVYLSQEARHYTLPILLIALSLVGLLQIHKDLRQQKLRYFVLLGWAAVNCLGFYTHYFFILAFVAEVVTLLAFMYSQRRTLPRYSVLAITLSILLVVASFIPWLLVMTSHFNRSETTWLPQRNYFAPIYQMLATWVLMLIALPVENQPWWIAVPFGLVMLVFSIWLARLIFRGLKQLLHSPTTHLSTRMLLSFTVIVLLEFLVIVYFLGKDITIAPRYNFVYYPSFCALVGASLGVQNFWFKLRANYVVIIFGLISSLFVVTNLAFQKPFNPEGVAQNMNLEPATPLMMVVGYATYQDVALGLSFALALEKIRSDRIPTNLAFFARSPGYESVWQKLSTAPLPDTTTLNVWVVASGLRRRDYPSQLTVSHKPCQIDTTQHYRIGIPYQLYRCRS